MTRMQYDHYRNGAGEPLVLLHGLTASWRVWYPVLDRLAERHAVYAPTLPGHRGGPALPAPFTVDRLVDGVEIMLDSAGISSSHIAGNSLGGIVALELLRRGRARSVVNFNGPFAWRDQRDIIRLNRIFTVNANLIRAHPLLTAAGRSRATRRHLLRTMMNHGDRLTPHQLRSMFADARHCTLARPLIRTLLTEGPRPPLVTGAVPEHVAWSHHDRLVPYPHYGAPTVGQLPGAHLTRLPGVGHVPMWDNPRLVIDTIERAITAI